MCGVGVAEYKPHMVATLDLTAFVLASTAVKHSLNRRHIYICDGLTGPIKKKKPITQEPTAPRLSAGKHTMPRHQTAPSVHAASAPLHV